MTPGRFLLAILRSRPWLGAATVVVGTLWLVPGALIPLVAGSAVDAGVAGGDTAAFARDVEDQQSRARRLRKVGFWTLSLAVHALFMGMAGNVI